MNTAYLSRVSFNSKHSYHRVLLSRDGRILEVTWDVVAVMGLRVSNSNLLRLRYNGIYEGSQLFQKAMANPPLNAVNSFNRLRSLGLSSETVFSLICD